MNILHTLCQWYTFETVTLLMGRMVLCFRAMVLQGVELHQNGLFDCSKILHTIFTRYSNYESKF